MSRTTLAFGVCIALFSMIVPFSQPFFRVELCYNEGWNIYNAVALANRQLLYGVRYGWTTNNYPMLSFAIAAQLHRVTHDYLFTARILCLLSLLAASLLVAATVRQLGATRRAAWLAGLFCVAVFCADTTNYVGVDDPQLLAHALFLFGLYLYVRYRERAGWLALTALVFVIAGSIKHNPIDVPIAVVIDLAIVAWRRAVWFTVCGLAFAGAALALQIHLGGPYFLCEIFAPRVYVDGKIFEQYLNVFGPILLPFLLAGWTAWRVRHDPQRRIAAILLATSLVVGGYFGGGQGVSINCLFTALFATVILLGLFFSQVERTPLSRWRWVPAGIFLWLAIPMIVFGTWNPVQRIVQTIAAQQSFDDEVAFLRAHPGPALCESLLRCYEAGKPYLYDPFNATRLMRFHDLDEKLLTSAIERRQYPAIELESPVEQEMQVDFHEERFDQPVLQAIAINYRPAMVHDGAVLYVPIAP